MCRKFLWAMCVGTMVCVQSGVAEEAADPTERVWNAEAKFRARLGPLDYRQFCRFTPAGDGLEPLCQLVRSYVGPHFDFDVRPVLKADEVPWCKLGGEGPDQSRLGWNTWIRSDPFDHDVDDAVFEMEGLPWHPSI